MEKSQKIEKIKYWHGENIDKLEENQIFVFGSNPKGSHGAGAAKIAFDNFGAIKNKGRGLMGKSYGLITKNLKWDIGFYEKETGITYDKGSYKSVSPQQISDNVKELYECARQNPDKEFLIIYKNDKWPNGSGKKSLNGYYPLEMLGFFIDNKDIPDNIVFHESFKEDIELKLKTNIIKDKVKMREQINQAYEQMLNSKGEKKITTFFTMFDVFSQWHPSKFTHKDFTFSSAEQYMMFRKAKLFKDEKTATKIMSINKIRVVSDFLEGKITKENLLSNSSPDNYLNDKTLSLMIYQDKLNEVKSMADLWSVIQARVKSLGKEVCKYSGSPWDEKLWEQEREKIIFTGSYCKYSQNEDMLQILISKKETILVEASPYDKIYGVGLRKTDARIKDPSQWLGLNLLGKSLTNLCYAFVLEMENNVVNENIEESKKKEYKYKV